MALLWTSNEDDILIDMVLSGKTVNEIALSLPNRQRDSIAGRIRRLRTAGKLPALENESKPKRRKATTRESTKIAKPKKAKSQECASDSEPKPKKPKEPPYVPEPRPLHPLEKLGQRDCRWPMGDPRDRASFQFCGKPIEQGFPYCREHTLKAFTSGGKIREDRELETA